MVSVEDELDSVSQNFEAVPSGQAQRRNEAERESAEQAQVELPLLYKERVGVRWVSAAALDYTA